jgi:hypothetical protein
MTDEVEILRRDLLQMSKLHRLEAYATLGFRTAERSPGAIAVHLKRRRDNVNVA